LLEPVLKNAEVLRTEPGDEAAVAIGYCDRNENL
jgi:hypothetical protein